MNIPFVDLKSQYQALKPKIQSRIDTVLEHGQYIMGPEVYELEKKLADYVGVKHCIAVSSGSDSLFIAMMALGIKSGDEVITTPFTYIATGEMITLIGATPVFVDIDSKNYNIDAALIEAAITPKTKAIMPVSLYGQCANFDKINEIAKKYKLPVIEDAAQSFGANYKGKRSCGLSTVGSTSFFPSKPLGCYGDGGALFTDDDYLAKLMREIGNHGQDGRYNHVRVGINARMDTIQAAILNAKMEIFPDEVKARQRIASMYGQLLEHKFAVPYIESYNESVFAQYTLLLSDHSERNEMQNQLTKYKIPSVVHYPTPLNLQPVFRYLNKPEGSFPISEKVAKRVLSLPMSPYLSEKQINKISSVILK